MMNPNIKNKVINLNNNHNYIAKANQDNKKNIKYGRSLLGQLNSICRNQNLNI